MTNKPTYEELKQRVRELEDEVASLRQAEDALRKSEKEYRNLFDSLPDPVAIVQDNLSVKLNPSFTRLFGYSLQDIENGIGALGLVKNDKDKEIARRRIETRLSGKMVTPEFPAVDLVS
jgi:PAS domain-containing protein